MLVKIEPLKKLKGYVKKGNYHAINGTLYFRQNKKHCHYTMTDGLKLIDIHQRKIDSTDYLYPESIKSAGSPAGHAFAYASLDTVFKITPSKLPLLNNID